MAGDAMISTAAKSVGRALRLTATEWRWRRYGATTATTHTTVTTAVRAQACRQCTCTTITMQLHGPISPSPLRSVCSSRHQELCEEFLVAPLSTEQARNRPELVATLWA
jgi:hypothetical protein